MTIGIIELNDAGVRVGKVDQWDGDYSESPGLALIGKKDLLLGDAAMRQSRLHPVETNSLFWQRLSEEPLQLSNSQYRHHADLAYSHLLSLHQTIPDCDEIIFALPGSFTRQQMSLLLGIVSQCPFDAVGLVDSAVAASANHIRASSAIHLDLQLHQCIFTRMQADEQLKRTAVDVLGHCGLLGLRDRWAKAIADQFIDQARFDPLHSASSEQSLHDQLPDWLQQCVRNGEVFLEINGKHIKLTREQFVAAVRPVYRQIVGKATEMAGQQSQLLLSDRLAALPGLLEAFEQSVDALPATAVMEGIHSNIDAVKTGAEQLSFVQALPTATAPAQAVRRGEHPSAATPAQTRSKQPTHLLLGDTAYPLGDTNLYLDLEQQRLARAASAVGAHCSIHKQTDGITLFPLGGATFVINQGGASERRASDNCLLHCGDKVNLEGHGTAPFTLIEVADVNGS